MGEDKDEDGSGTTSSGRVPKKGASARTRFDSQSKQSASTAKKGVVIGALLVLALLGGGTALKSVKKRWKQFQEERTKRKELHSSLKSSIDYIESNAESGKLDQLAASLDHALRSAQGLGAEDAKPHFAEKEDELAGAMPAIARCVRGGFVTISTLEGLVDLWPEAARQAWQKESTAVLEVLKKAYHVEIKGSGYGLVETLRSKFSAIGAPVLEAEGLGPGGKITLTVEIETEQYTHTVTNSGTGETSKGTLVSLPSAATLTVEVTSKGQTCSWEGRRVLRTSGYMAPQIKGTRSASQLISAKEQGLLAGLRQQLKALKAPQRSAPEGN